MKSSHGTSVILEVTFSSEYMTGGRHDQVVVYSHGDSFNEALNLAHQRIDKMFSGRFRRHGVREVEAIK